MDDYLSFTGAQDEGFERGLREQNTRSRDHTGRFGPSFAQPRHQYDRQADGATNNVTLQEKKVEIDLGRFGPPPGGGEPEAQDGVVRLGSWQPGRAGRRAGGVPRLYHTCG